MALKTLSVIGGEITEPTQIEPGDIDMERFLGFDKPIPALHYGNKVNCLMPAYPQAWMSEITGCKICASSVSCSALGADVRSIDSFSIVDACTKLG